MSHSIFAVIYFLVMAGVIVAVDVLFLRDHVWIRLGVNIGIVVVFAAFYLLVFRNVRI